MSEHRTVVAYVLPLAELAYGFAPQVSDLYVIVGGLQPSVGRQKVDCKRG